MQHCRGNKTLGFGPERDVLSLRPSQAGALPSSVLTAKLHTWLRAALSRSNKKVVNNPLMIPICFACT